MTGSATPPRDETPIHEERYHPEALGSRGAELRLKRAKDPLPKEVP